MAQREGMSSGEENERKWNQNIKWQCPVAKYSEY